VRRRAGRRSPRRAAGLARRAAGPPVTTLTAARAQALNAAAVARGMPPMWFVCTDPAHPSCLVARAYVEPHAGGGGWRAARRARRGHAGRAAHRAAHGLEYSS
jgi:hypothetical protein